MGIIRGAKFPGLALVRSLAGHTWFSLSNTELQSLGCDTIWVRPFKGQEGEASTK